MEKLDAREYVTFGGSAAAETSDPVAQHLVSQGRGGDFRMRNGYEHGSITSGRKSALP
ncbi:hypothetical protein [Streptomyces sp. NPDC059258]|uniref:hypothetical protein n=1 Tax=unclassified Streptomyces TaxID=2593676 RepID=UPI003699D920